ncbi:class I SAM-dependent methyltransferase [Halosimplex marinum]|uniref:class I SAM-dependent methyltransferase n=1 Tax=Halosimplex marinum TaxID=3396620 RepID=UPI003F5443D3
MTTDLTRRIQQSYQEVADACGIENARHQSFASANDAILLEKVLKNVESEGGRVLDLGCCGYPWVTNFLRNEGYEVVGTDVYKPTWYDKDLVGKLGVPLVAYDGHDLPFKAGSFDLVLMFGVLEHVGVWKTSEEKYRECNPEVTKHRRDVLDEVQRVLSDEGVLYITKFPNTHGRDKYLSKMINGDIGHLNSERARPEYLRDLIGESFEIRSFFADGLLPHRIPFDLPFSSVPNTYSKVDKLLSNAPLLKEFAQNYCVIATPR